MRRTGCETARQERETNRLVLPGQSIIICKVQGLPIISDILLALLFVLLIVHHDALKYATRLSLNYLRQHPCARATCSPERLHFILFSTARHLLISPFLSFASFDRSFSHFSPLQPLQSVAKWQQRSQCIPLTVRRPSTTSP